MSLAKIRLERVHYMPRDLSPGVLYVSEEFGTAAHLCACGCGAKVRTPLGPAEWSLEETVDGPTLRPSVGNWQQACQSHYLITAGEVVWAMWWNVGQVVEGRQREEERRSKYYARLERKHRSIVRRLVRWISGVFRF